MRNYIKPNKSFEDTLATIGFDLYGKGTSDPNWVAKGENGTYFTLTADGAYTFIEWIPMGGTNITDDQFIAMLTGDDEQYDELHDMFYTKSRNPLEIYFIL